MECRIYAEDPDNNYFPSPGRIEMLTEPGGPGIRLDSGVYAGWTVPIDYDPLLAKLIACGEDRPQSISRLTRALQEFFAAGIKTNVSLFRRILADKDFQAGRIDTGFLERLPPCGDDAKRKLTAEVAAVGAAIFTFLDSKSAAPNNGNPASSGWKKAARTEGLM